MNTSVAANAANSSVASAVAAQEAVIDFINTYSVPSSSPPSSQLPTSKNVNQANSKLLDAALPVLGLGTKLKELQQIPDKKLLKQLLVSQIELFLNKIRKAFYDEKTVMASCYAVCAFLDETLFDANWETPLTLDLEQDSLLRYFTNSATDGKKFFVILKEAYAEASANVDLLELLYVCLSLGFAGKYKTSKKGQQSIRDLTDNLYACMVKLRPAATPSSSGLLVNALDIIGKDGNFVSAAKNIDGKEKTAPRFLSRGMWIAAGFVVLIGGCIYVTLSMRLANIAQTLFGSINM